MRPLLLAGCMAVLPLCVQAQSQSQSPDDGDSALPSFLRPSPNGDHWRLIASPYTVHYHKDDSGEHRDVYMIGVERQRADGWMWGGVYFSNSFGQPSAYVYLGQQYEGFIKSVPQLFAQWSLGVLYGYVEPYEDKVPFNHNGFSPGATLSLGWRFTRNFSVQMDALGAAAMMFQLSWDFR